MLHIFKSILEIFLGLFSFCFVASLCINTIFCFFFYLSITWGLLLRYPISSVSFTLTLLRMIYFALSTLFQILDELHYVMWGMWIVQDQKLPNRHFPEPSTQSQHSRSFKCYLAELCIFLLKKKKRKVMISFELIELPGLVIFF